MECRARLPRTVKICHLGAPCLLGAATTYEGSGKSLVRALKFHGIRDAAQPLGELLATYAAALPISWEGMVAVPVPLGKRRLRERGFNQAELIARTFAENLHLELLPAALRRTRNTKPQSGTESAKERLANIAGCFLADSRLVQGQSLVLLDDVVTSGTTFMEAARALKAAGAKQVIALAATMA